ncbi:hypothetical protein SELMODRAFT_106264 [Selaginella moellendorffii]|uniref:Uncharacterized protein n=1 Tax=Selaginella moellendorffii TaxID=88036 RepID=D8S1I2_SELML|nr:hypothetical protein SELMODRAFT_106264 [Selaginella moellendorffii]
MEITDELVGTMFAGAVFKDCGGKINSLDFNPSEDLLVTACDDESIRLYDTANAKLTKTTQSKKYGVDQICFTHSSHSVVCSSKNGWDGKFSLRYLDLSKNTYLRYFKGHRDRVVCLCVNPKSQILMSASLDNTVRIWDLRSNVCHGLIRVHGRPSVAYDHSGLVFGVSMDGGAIKLFDSRIFEKGPFDTFYIQDSTAEVSGMKFSSDGKLMLASTTDSNVYVLDAFNGKQLHVHKLEPCPDGGTLEASFSPDGQVIISGSGNGTLHAWNAVTGTEIATWTSSDGVPSVVKWDPRHLMFASAASVLTFWIPDVTKLNTPRQSHNQYNYY